MGTTPSAPALCGEPYTRTSGPSGTTVYCTFRTGHLRTQEAPTPHSWTWLRDAEREIARDDTPSDVKAILDAITAGNADPYLEAILAVTHNRKRALRGVRGFPL